MKTLHGGREYVLEEEVTGHHHGQTDAYLRFIDSATGRVAAYLDYTIYRGAYHIGMVESFVPSAGLGTALMVELARLAGGYKNVRPGFMTEAGGAVWRKLVAKWRQDEKLARARMSTRRITNA